MKYLTCLVFLLWTGLAYADDFKYMHYLAGIDRQELLEPSIDKMVEWIPEEIPRTVSFYFDTDSDGDVDLIIAYSMIEAYDCTSNCTQEIQEYKDHWILISSKDHMPYSYYVLKKWLMWRNSTNDEWKALNKTSESVYKYEKYDDWYEHKFLELWPEMAP